MFTLNFDEIKTGNGGSLIIDSGIYEVILVALIAQKSDKNKSLNIVPVVEYNDKVQAIYGDLRVKNNDGSINSIGKEKVIKLMAALHLETIPSSTIETSLAIGKDGASKDVEVYDVEVGQKFFIQIKQEYSVWNDSIYDNKRFRQFFDKDGLSIGEMKAKHEGKKVAARALDRTKADPETTKPTYKNDLDEATIKAWKEAGYPKGQTVFNTADSDDKEETGSLFG